MSKDSLDKDTGKPVAWQFYQDGEWHIGGFAPNHRENTEAAGFPVRDLIAGEVIKLKADKLRDGQIEKLKDTYRRVMQAGVDEGGSDLLARTLYSEGVRIICPDEFICNPWELTEEVLEKIAKKAIALPIKSLYSQEMEAAKMGASYVLTGKWNV